MSAPADAMFYRILERTSWQELETAVREMIELNKGWWPHGSLVIVNTDGGVLRPILYIQAMTQRFGERL